MLKKQSDCLQSGLYRFVCGSLPWFGSDGCSLGPSDIPAAHDKGYEDSGQGEREGTDGHNDRPLFQTENCPFTFLTISFIISHISLHAVIESDRLSQIVLPEKLLSPLDAAASDRLSETHTEAEGNIIFLSQRINATHTALAIESNNRACAKPGVTS